LNVRMPTIRGWLRRGRRAREELQGEYVELDPNELTVQKGAEGRTEGASAPVLQ
jgi:hypothetical protein